MSIQTIERWKNGSLRAKIFGVRRPPRRSCTKAGSMFKRKKWSMIFKSKKGIAPGGFPPPFANGRPAGSALYFMVTPDARVRLHRIRNDQLYHYYLGDPIEVLMLHADGTSEHAIVGPDLRGGQLVQLLIPGNTFHTARVIGQGRRWFLGASTEWPGVEPADVEIGDVEALAAKYP